MNEHDLYDFKKNNLSSNKIYTDYYILTEISTKKKGDVIFPRVY